MNPIVRAHEFIAKLLDTYLDELEKIFDEGGEIRHTDLVKLGGLIGLYNKTSPIEPTD